MQQVGRFERLAAIIRTTQRAAIEIANAPDKRKRLRSFGTAEVSGLLGIDSQELKQLAFGAGLGPCHLGKTRYAFNDLARLRTAAASGGLLIPRSRRPEEPLGAIAFCNFKGGSGKTTSAVHFAQYLALHGYRVLLVDLDSQGSATGQFLDTPFEDDETFTAWLKARDDRDPIDAGRLCKPTHWPSIDIVPAGPSLAAAEERLTARAGRGETRSPLYFEELRAFLRALDARYDVAVIDTRPDVNMLMTNALHTASGIIVPTRAAMIDIASTGEFFGHLAGYVADFQAAFGEELPSRFCRILVTAYDPTDRSQEALVALIRERFNEDVLAAEFLHSRVMGTATLLKETIYEYEPTSDRAAFQRVLGSANAVNSAIERELWTAWDRDITTNPEASTGP